MQAAARAQGDVACFEPAPVVLGVVPARQSAVCLALGGRWTRYDFVGAAASDIDGYLGTLARRHAGRIAVVVQEPRWGPAKLVEAKTVHLWPRERLLTVMSSTLTKHVRGVEALRDTFTTWTVASTLRGCELVRVERTVWQKDFERAGRATRLADNRFAASELAGEFAGRRVPYKFTYPTCLAFWYLQRARRPLREEV